MLPPRYRDLILSSTLKQDGLVSDILVHFSVNRSYFPSYPLSHVMPLPSRHDALARESGVQKVEEAIRTHAII